MKKYIIIPVVAAVLVIALFNSCKKYDKLLKNVLPANAAYLKVIHAAPGFTQVFNAPDNFNVLVGGINGQRIAAAFTYNSAFPANTINTDTYAAVPSGSQDIRLALKGVANIDSIPVAIIPKNLSAGSYYTLVITDSITTTSDFSKIWVADNFTTPASGSYGLRFIHAVMNDTAGKNVDVYSFRTASNIFSNITPGTATPFTTQTVTGILDTLSIRRAGTTFELARLNGVNYTNNQRVYTLVYRGDGRLTSGTKARGAFVYNNR
jgi:hypothetical protein